jgi:hypothetical protein
MMTSSALLSSEEAELQPTNVNPKARLTINVLSENIMYPIYFIEGLIIRS